MFVQSSMTPCLAKLAAWSAWMIAYLYVCIYVSNTDYYCFYRKTFSCPECDQKYKREQDLNKHMCKCHGETLKFNCDQCDKRFLELSALRRHMERHRVIHDEMDPVSPAGLKSQQFASISDIITHYQILDMELWFCSITGLYKPHF